MRCLEIGGGPLPQAHEIWKDDTWESMDADKQYDPDHLHDAFTEMPEELKGQFDRVFASHVLEHTPYFNAVGALRNWASLLSPTGELHVIVPSLEWAAREILKNQPSPGVFGHLYGGQTTQWDAHYGGFTLRLLRKCFEEVGLLVVRARTGEYQIGFMGKAFPAEQHYVAGVMAHIGDPKME